MSFCTQESLRQSISARSATKHNKNSNPKGGSGHPLSLLPHAGNVWILCFLLTTSLVPSVAQVIPDVEIGEKPFGSYHETDIDSVNLLNGDLTIKVPLVSYPQRGDLKFEFFASTGSDRPRPPLHIQGRGTSTVITTLQYAYRPKVGLTWSGGFRQEAYTSYGGNDVCANNEFLLYGSDPPPPPPNPDCPSPNTSGYPIATLVDPLGGVHQFAAVGNQLSGPTGSSLEESIDGSGYQTQFLPYGSASNTSTFIDRSGMTVTSTTDGNTVTDRNGNFMNSSLARSSWTDSAGRVVPFPQNGAVSGCPGNGDVAGASTSASTWTIPGYNGQTVTYTLCYITEHTLAGYTCNNLTNNNVHYQFVYTSLEISYMNAVVLPNGQMWRFVTFNGVASDGIPNNDGSKFEIVTPTGGTITYSLVPRYSPDDMMDNVCYAAYDNLPGISPRMSVQSKTVNANDGTGAHTWTYSFGSNSSGDPTTTVTDPLENDTVHTFTQVPNAGVNYYETATTQYNGSKSANVVLKTTTTSYSGYLNPQDFVTTAMALPTSITVTTPAGSVTTAKTYDNSGAVITGTPAMMGIVSGDTTHPLVYGNVVDEKVSGIGTTGTIKETVTTPEWQGSPSYLSANLLDSPASVVIKDGGGHACEETDYTYDDAAHFVTLDGSDTFVGHSAAPASVRGNLSLETKILSNTPCTSSSLSGTSVTTQTWVSDLGTIESSKDPLQYPTTYTHDSATHIYVIKTTNALNQSVSGTYDSNTGLLTSYTDLNQKTSTYNYDELGRLTCVEYPDGGSIRFSINDTALTVDKITRLNGSDACASTSGNIDLQYQFDGLGRQSQTRLLSDPVGTIYQDTTYDAIGRLASTSNPYRSSSESTYGVTGFTYDALDRKTIQTDSDGVSQRQWCYDGVLTSGQSNCHSHLASGASEWVDVADEDGNDSQQSFDSLGRITSVIEPNGTSRTPPSLETDYSYNLVGLLGVNQWGGPSGSSGARARSFSYDSLSRLLSAANPETGSISYIFDLDGNVKTKTDARGVQVTYSYDNLNRLLSKSYSDATPSSCYQYDSSSVRYGIGRLANAWTQSSSCPAAPSAFWTNRSILSYDEMGRVLNEQQFIPGNATNGAITPPCPNRSAETGLSYCYDFAGNLTFSTNGMNSPSYLSGQNPIGLTYSYDSAGRLKSITSNNSAYPTNLFSPPSGQESNPCGTPSAAAQYWPFGGLMNALLGNGVALNRGYDKRLRTGCEKDTGSIQ